MGVAEYRIVSKGNGWSVLHDGAAANSYVSKEAAFESAVAAASLALQRDMRYMSACPGETQATAPLLESKNNQSNPHSHSPANDDRGIRSLEVTWSRTSSDRRRNRSLPTVAATSIHNSLPRNFR